MDDEEISLAEFRANDLCVQRVKHYMFYDRGARYVPDDQWFYVMRFMKRLDAMIDEMELHIREEDLEKLEMEDSEYEESEDGESEEYEDEEDRY